MPPLPDSLRKFEIDEAREPVFLPPLPEQLDTLILHRIEKLAPITHFPPGLRKLDIGWVDPSISLCSLPSNLKVLDLSGLAIKSLPVLPAGLEEIVLYKCDNLQGGWYPPPALKKEFVKFCPHLLKMDLSLRRKVIGQEFTTLFFLPVDTLIRIAPNPERFRKWPHWVDAETEPRYNSFRFLGVLGATAMMATPITRRVYLGMSIVYGCARFRPQFQR